MGRRAQRIVGSKRNPHHQSIVKKHGAHNIQVFIFECDTEQQAFDDEIKQIAQLRRDGYRLSNKTNGGEGAGNPTDETRAKISAFAKGRKTRLGAKLSQEAKDKIAKAHKGKKLSPEHRAQAAIAGIGNRSKTGMTNSAETIKKILASRSWYKHSDETRKKMSAAARQRNKLRGNN